MSRFRRLAGMPPRPLAVRREVDEELALHLELRAQELVAEGWDPAQARMEAERLFGDLAAHRDTCVTVDQERMLAMQRQDRFDALRQDVSFAFRAFRRRPVVTAMATAVLALGIGAAVAVFSLANAVLLQPLPYAGPDRLVSLRSRDDQGSFSVSEAERLRYREETGVFTGVATWAFGNATLTQPSRNAEQLRAGFVEADLFPVAGLELTLGRGFTAEEDRLNGAPAVVLSYLFWRERFGGDSAALGQTLTLGGTPRTIVGVMAPAVRLPDDFVEPSVQLYLPLALSPTPDPRNLHYLGAVARLAPGTTPEALDARLALVSRELAAEIATLPRRFRIEARPVADVILGQYRPAMVMLAVAVGLLLLLACANIAGLLLAVAESRQREFALRTALGAAGGRLARQVVTESALLGLAGGAAGLGLGVAALRALLATSPPGLPRAGDVRVDGLVVAASLAATLFTVLVCGLIPALRVRRRHPEAALRGGGRGTADRQRHRARRVLVLAEVALAVTIAVGAGLVVRSWLALLATDPGFPMEGRLTLQVVLPGQLYPAREDRWRFYASALDALRALPGVRAAGAVSALPLGDRSGDWGFDIAGRPPVPQGERKPFADLFMVTHGYFEAMGVPLRQGRSLEPSDDASGLPVIVINESVARRYWPDGNALGARIRLSTNIDSLWRTVVGIVGDVRSRGLDQPPNQEFYFPYAQFPGTTNANARATMSVVLRAAAQPAALAGPSRAALRALDPSVPVARVQTMDQVLDTTLSVRRFQLALLGFFALSGLVLAALGVYGVVAFLVQQRTREFGVRMALGATRGGILRMVLRDCGRLGLAGAAIGLAAALVASRWLRGLLYQVGPADPVVLVGVPLLVLGVVLASALVPARRAAGTSPGETLRAE